MSTLTSARERAGRDRRITLPDASAKFFAARCTDRKPEELLLRRADGSPWNKDAGKKPLKQVAIDTKLPPGTVAYALRHSAITDLIALHRIDTMTVAQITGTTLLLSASWRTVDLAPAT